MCCIVCVGPSVHRQACPNNNWRTFRPTTVFKLDRDVVHDQETTHINIKVVKATVGVTVTFNTKSWSGLNWGKSVPIVFKLDRVVGYNE